MNQKTPLERFRELLKIADRETLAAECQSMFAAEIDHKEIVRLLLEQVTGNSLGDPAWLPAASAIGLSDSLVHVPLQATENKHRLMAFGQRRPPFRRIEEPPPLAGDLEELQSRFEEAAIGNDWNLGERCLLGIAETAGIAAVFESVLGCLLQPRYLGVTSGSWWAGVRHLSVACMIDLWQEFGDDSIRKIICYLGARQCATHTGEQGKVSLEAMKLFESESEKCAQPANKVAQFDEATFYKQLGSGSVQTAFRAITEAVQQGASIEQLDLALTMYCVERLLRAGLGGGANWDDLKRELMAVATIRRANLIDSHLAIKAAYHAAWQIVKHGDSGLADHVPEMNPHAISNQDEQIMVVIDGIGGSNPARAIAQANNFVAGGHDPEQLLREMILWVNTRCKGSGYYAGQRGMIDAWHLAKDHPDRNRIVLALAGWMADYRNQHFNHRKCYGVIWGANLSADGKLLAVRSGGTRVFDVPSGKELMFFRGNPWRFAFHPLGRMLACGWDGGQLQIWDLIARSLVKEIDAFPDDVSGQFGDGKFWGLQFSPNGDMLAGCSRGCCEVKVWSAETWELKFELAGHTHHRNESVTFSVDSQVIATGGNDGTVRLWDANTGKQLRVFNGHTDETARVTAVDFHPDGERIVSAESASEIIIWNWQSGDVLVRMQGENYCNYAGFGPDGKTLISDHQGTLCYWDADTGELLESITAIPKAGQHTLFGGANQSRDRCTIVTAGWEGLVRVWNSQSRKEICSFQLALG